MNKTKVFEKTDTSSCHICGRQTQAVNMAKHLILHEKETRLGRTYNCVFCDETFNDKFLHEKHVKSKHAECVANEGKNKVDCKICGVTLIDVAALRRHLKVHNSKFKKLVEPEKCLYCDDVFQDKLSIRNHIIANHQEYTFASNTSEVLPSKYKCPECEFASSLGVTREHYKVKHLANNISLACPYCPVELFDRGERKYHVKRHLDAQGNIHFNCNECPAKFKGPEEFAVHYKEHYEKRKYSCGVCARRFTNAYNCSLHESTAHQGKKKEEEVVPPEYQEFLTPGPERNKANLLAFICKECGTKAYGVDSFRDHLNRHTNVFKCDLCEYSVKTMDFSLMERHMHTHSDEKRFKCELCGEKFKQKQILAGHLKTLHAVKKLCTCEDCGQDFQDEHCHKVHVKNEHGGTNKCSLCDLKFSSVIARYQHLKDTHPESFENQCHICGEPIRKTRELLAHLKTHEPSKQQCIICEEDFQDEYSLIQHANAMHDGKRLKCDICGSLWQTKKQLTEHRKSVHKEGKYKCEKCQYCTEWKSYFELHKKNKCGARYKCKKCQYSTQVGALFERHKRNNCGKSSNETLEEDNDLNESDENSKNRESAGDGSGTPSSSFVIEHTPLPIAVAIFKELKKKPANICFAWTKRIEPDLVKLMTMNPTRLLIYIIEESISNTANRQKHGYKFEEARITINTPKGATIKIAVFGSKVFQFDETVFSSISSFAKAIYKSTGLKKIKHFLRKTNENSILDDSNLLINELKSEQVVCNCLQV